MSDIVFTGVCGICGKKTKDHFGFSIQYKTLGHASSFYRGLCRGCSVKMQPFLSACISLLYNEATKRE